MFGCTFCQRSAGIQGSKARILWWTQEELQFVGFVQYDGHLAAFSDLELCWTPVFDRRWTLVCEGEFSDRLRTLTHKHPHPGLHTGEASTIKITASCWSHQLRMRLSRNTQRAMASGSSAELLSLCTIGGITIDLISYRNTEPSFKQTVCGKSAVRMLQVIILDGPHQTGLLICPVCRR